MNQTKDNEHRTATLTATLYQDEIELAPLTDEEVLIYD